MIRDDLLAAGSTLAADNDWEKLSVNVWQYYRRKTVEKIERRSKSGAAGGEKQPKWSAVDDLVVAILGKQLAVITGVSVTESGEREEDPNLAVKSMSNFPMDIEIGPSQVR